MKRKSIIWWAIFVALIIWQLPQFLISLVMLPFLGKKKLVADRHFNFCWMAEKMQGGISLGPFAFVSPGLCSAESIAHEVDGHTVQSKILSWLYLPIVGIFSLIHAWLHDPSKSCYYDYWCEKWANNCAGLKTDKYCRLKFK